MKNINIFYKILESADIDEIVSTTNVTSWIFDGECRERFINTIIDILKDSITTYFEYIEADCYDIDLESIVSEYSWETEYGEEIDEDALIQSVELKIEALAE